jgi:hypothetical protein
MKNNPTTKYKAYKKYMGELLFINKIEIKISMMLKSFSDFLSVKIKKILLIIHA